MADPVDVEPAQDHDIAGDRPDEIDPAGVHVAWSGGAAECALAIDRDRVADLEAAKVSAVDTADLATRESLVIGGEEREARRQPVAVFGVVSIAGDPGVRDLCVGRCGEEG